METAALEALSAPAAFELRVLALSALLAAAQLVLMAVPANVQLGSAYLASARDEQRPRHGKTARLERAFRNQLEGLTMFAPAAVAAVLLGASSPFTQGCAVAYLAARVVYVPLYAFGVPYWRSAVWAVGFFATVAMLIAALL